MSILEEELYIPVKKYFENKGFKIKGEVKNCDMAGVKGDILLVAGKGGEREQEIMGIKYGYSDKTVIENILGKLQ